MENLISRENLRRDIQEYAVCMYQPMLMSREKAIFVVDNIPGAVVRCCECKHKDSCKFNLGDDGYCSKGEA